MRDIHAKLRILDFYQLFSFPFIGPNRDQTFLMNSKIFITLDRQNNTCETLVSFTLGCVITLVTLIIRKWNRKKSRQRVNKALM